MTGSSSTVLEYGSVWNTSIFPFSLAAACLLLWRAVVGGMWWEVGNDCALSFLALGFLHVS